MAAKQNGQLDTPMNTPFGANKSMTAAKGTYDKYPAPFFNKPRSMGRNSLPEKIIDGNLGAGSKGKGLA